MSQPIRFEPRWREKSWPPADSRHIRSRRLAGTRRGLGRGGTAMRVRRVSDTEMRACGGRHVLGRGFFLGGPERLGRGRRHARRVSDGPDHAHRAGAREGSDAVRLARQARAAASRCEPARASARRARGDVVEVPAQRDAVARVDRGRGSPHQGQARGARHRRRRPLRARGCGLRLRRALARVRRVLPRSGLGPRPQTRASTSARSSSRACTSPTAIASSPPTAPSSSPSFDAPKTTRCPPRTRARAESRVRALFRRQLAVPHAQLEETRAMAEAWESARPRAGGGKTDADAARNPAALPPETLAAYAKASSAAAALRPRRHHRRRRRVSKTRARVDQSALRAHLRDGDGESSREPRFLGRPPLARGRRTNAPSPPRPPTRRCGDDTPHTWMPRVAFG